MDNYPYAVGFVTLNEGSYPSNSDISLVVVVVVVVVILGLATESIQFN